MFIVFSIPDPIPRISVLAEFDADPIYRDRHDVQSEKVKIELPEEAESPIEMIADDVADQQELQLADNPNKALNSIAENDDSLNQPGRCTCETEPADDAQRRRIGRT